AKTFQNGDEALRVARVQADGGLVKDVECADEMRTQRSGQLDALRFSSRESGGQAVEREVVEADFVQKLQAGANLFQDFIGNFGLRFREAQFQEKLASFLHGELAQLRDGFAGDAHGAGLGAQARAAAFGTRGVPAKTAQENAHVKFVLFALEPGEKAFYAVEIVFGIAFENQTALLGGELAPGDVCGDAASASPLARFLHEDAVARLGPGLNGAIIERFAGVGDDEVEIEIDGVAKALAARACAIGIVEREETRLGLLIKRTVILALEALIEGEALGGGAGGIGGKFQDGFAAAFAVADFDGIDEARAGVGVGGEAVDKNVDGLGEIDVQERFRRVKFVDAAFLVEPVEAALLQILQHQAQGILGRRGDFF